ncbi:MAG TPA: 50S ribosomal protein L21 [bacterium]|jgi:large subunit ribosomal protein L21|nr:50S ribosomal protein L21 [bacterium]
MYAIIETGGKQFRVAANDTINVEQIDIKAGEKLSLERVLLVADGDKVTVGKPLVGGARVQALVVAHKRGTRVRAEKFKRRTGQYHRHGHRQYMTTLKIEAISLA